MKTLEQVYEDKFQSLIDVSGLSDPDARRPLVSKARDLTAAVCPVKVATQLPFVTFHTFDKVLHIINVYIMYIKIQKLCKRMPNFSNQKF